MTDELDLSTCSEAELWRYVAWHLEASGIGVVLVGGAVVAILHGRGVSIRGPGLRP